MQYIGKVIGNKEIAENIWRMDIATGKIFRPLPGQFINVLVNDTYEPLLRRPFSIFDAAIRRVTIVYKSLGPGTIALAGKKSGDKLDFIGPLGKPYIGEKEPRIGYNVIVIGGGTGAASTYYLAKYLGSKRIKFTFIQGARCKDQMVAVPEFKKLGCVFTTDDGTLGKKGFVSSALREKLTDNSTVFACGPKPMLKAVKEVCAEKKNVKVLASFEEYMGCGIGACLSCVVETKSGEYKRVCKDGTVFDLDEVVIP